MDSVIARLQRERWGLIERQIHYRGMVEKVNEQIEDASIEAGDLQRVIEKLGADGGDSACKEAHEAQQKRLDEAYPSSGVESAVVASNLGYIR